MTPESLSQILARVMQCRSEIRKLGAGITSMSKKEKKKRVVSEKKRKACQARARATLFPYHAACADVRLEMGLPKGCLIRKGTDAYRAVMIKYRAALMVSRVVQRTDHST